MATYQEIHELHSDGPLTDRIETAIIKAAYVISSEVPSTTNHINRLVWAKQALSNPAGEAKKFLRAVLAANSDATIAAIQGAGDTAIQANVDSVVNLFAGE